MSHGRAGWTCWLALLLVAACLVPAASAGAKRVEQDFDDLPAWLQEAYGRPAGDSGAGLVWLHKELTIEPLVDEGVRIRERYAVRVTGEPGLDDVEYFGATYVLGDGVPRIDAWTVDEQKRVRRPDRRKDYDDLPSIQSFSIYEDTRYRSVRPPMITVGCVVGIEIEKVVSRDWGFSGLYFGDSYAPTLFQRFALELPEGWSFHAKTERAEALSLARSESGLVVEGRDIAALSRLEREVPGYEVKPSLALHWWNPGGSRGFQSWEEVGKAMHALAEPVLAEASNAVSRGVELAPREGEGLLAGIERAFDVAAREVRYVSVQVGIGGFRPYPPDQVLAKSYGDCKGKSFLMRALTSPWGVQSYPVLVRTRSLGPLSEETPAPNQFDHMIAALRLPDDFENPPWASVEVEGVGRLLFVDATASMLGALDLPEMDQGTRGLLLLPGGGKLVDLPVRPAHEAKVERRLEADLSPWGEWASARVTESWSGAAAAPLRNGIRNISRDEWERRFSERASRKFPGVEVGDLQLQGLEQEAGPLTVSYTLRSTREDDGERFKLIVKPGLIARGVVGRDLPRKLPKGSAFETGSTGTELVLVSIRLPEGMSPESLPAPAIAESEEFDFHAEWRFDEGVLTYERRAALKVLEVSGERYADFRKLARSLSKADRRAIVIVPE